MSEIRRIRRDNIGTILKQGDTAEVHFSLYDAENGNDSGILNQPAEVVFLQDETVVYTTNGQVDDMYMCKFHVETVLPAGLYHVEFIVNGGIYPSGDKPYFTITKSSRGADANIIKAYGFDDVVKRVISELELQDFSQDKADALYAPKTHTHTEYALKDHGHTEHATLGQRLDETTAQLAQNVQSIAMPENISTIKTKTPKLVIVGENNDELDIVQWNGVNYILYGLDSREGTSNVSVGENWDLIRLNKAIMANDVYVAKTQFDESSVVGTLGTTYESDLRNTIENYSVYTHPDEVQADFLSSSGDGKGVAVRRISGSSPSQVSWDVQIGTNRKCNMLLFGTTTSSTDVDILVNGEVVANVDTTKFAIGTNLTYKVLEFEIPTRVNISTSVKVTLRNNDTSGAYANFSCLNYMKLKDYDGRDIDFYKVFTTSRKWIDHAGSSDYAIFDKDLQQWCGSYHGGETRVSAQMTWASGSSWQPTVAWDTGRYTMRNKSDIPIGWYITPQLKLRQLTNINNKGRMLSIFDFDTDGTLQMNFSFFDGSIVAETFYTALATTHVGFNMVEYPRYENIPTDGSNVYLRNSEGYVIQRNSAKGLSLGSRFTLFGDRYIPNKLKTAGWIYNDANYYKKLYYGYADGYADGVLIESLQFRKSLDFMSS